MRRESGFVMADAISALLILAVLMAAIMSMSTTSAQNALAADMRLTGTLIARGIAEDESSEDKNGLITVDGQTFHWSKSEQRSSISENTKLQVKRVKVRVSWRQRSGESVVHYRTARWSAPNEQ